MWAKYCYHWVQRRPIYTLVSYLIPVSLRGQIRRYGMRRPLGYVCQYQHETSNSFRPGHGSKSWSSRPSETEKLRSSGGSQSGQEMTIQRRVCSATAT